MFQHLVALLIISAQRKNDGSYFSLPFSVWIYSWCLTRISCVWTGRDSNWRLYGACHVSVAESCPDDAQRAWHWTPRRVDAEERCTLGFTVVWAVDRTSDPCGGRWTPFVHYLFVAATIVANHYRHCRRPNNFIQFLLCGYNMKDCYVVCVLVVDYCNFISRTVSICACSKYRTKFAVVQLEQ